MRSLLKHRLAKSRRLPAIPGLPELPPGLELPPEVKAELRKGDARKPKRCRTLRKPSNRQRQNQRRSPTQPPTKSNYAHQSPLPFHPRQKTSLQNQSAPKTRCSSNHSFCSSRHHVQACRQRNIAGQSRRHRFQQTRQQKAALLGQSRWPPSRALDRQRNRRRWQTLSIRQLHPPGRSVHHELPLQSR